ncbi:hypothetical protein, partial [Niabella yanshanensis]|uniref:hypothetical protein n=1 Tax=Niabella yanshanensis TaxID=577386 RepID=UPI001B87E910
MQTKHAQVDNIATFAPRGWCSIMKSIAHGLLSMDYGLKKLYKPVNNILQVLLFATCYSRLTRFNSV